MVTVDVKTDDSSSPGGYNGYDGPAAVLDVPAYHPPPSAPPSQHPTPDQHVAVVISRAKEHKSLMEAYILWFPLGFLGLHHFYLKRPEMGVIYIFTLGLCGVGWLIDGFRMSCLVKAANKKIDHPTQYHPLTISDAYLLWFPFGIIGLHHYYLRQPAWGILYTFTLGLLGIGWLIDAFRMPCMVQRANIRLEKEHEHVEPKYVQLCDAYVLGATPLGLFGTHHFYMGRYSFGLFYLFTAGGCGIGWIVDWFRMKWLVERANNVHKTPLGHRQKYVDDAYVLAFPLGFLGTHHFYLERPGWGVLYLFTAGLGGVGWLFDLARMPCLVKDTNKKLLEEFGLVEGMRQQIAQGASASSPTAPPQGAGAAPGASANSYPQPLNAPSPAGGWTQVVPDIQAPPSYMVAVGGYSNQGHVYNMPAYPWQGGSAPQYPGEYPGAAAYPPVAAAYPPGAAAYPSGVASAYPPGATIHPYPGASGGEITGDLEKPPIK